MSEMWDDPNLVALRESLYSGWDMAVPENPEDVTAQSFAQPPATDGAAAATTAGNGTEYDPTKTMTAYERWLTEQQDTQAAQQRQNATATMRALLESYNLMSLYNTVVDYIKQGYDAEAVSVLIRTTPEYKTRFPAMSALAQKGRAISEAEYIEYEQTSSNLERRYGLPAGMLMSNVTRLLENEVSAAELNDRVLLASSASLQAPQEIRQQFQDYYGIDSGGLTAYFLDPQIATPLLERQAASARIGAEARRQDVGVDRATAEYLQSLGVTQEEARTGFGTVSQARGLTTGRGDVVTNEQLVMGTLAKDQGAQKEIERAIGARKGRFEGGGEFVQSKEGVVGLGSAATR